jgi:hypothetical protein
MKALFTRFGGVFDERKWENRKGHREELGV